MGGFIFISFFVFAIVVIVLAFSHQRRANLLESYRQLARRFGGHAERGGWLGLPTAIFRHNNTCVSVDVFSTGGRSPTHYTQVHFYWQQPVVRCEIYPEGYWTRMGKFFGIEDIEIGSPEFDNEFVIKGNDPMAIRQVLNPNVQWKIRQLHRFLGNNDIYISFGRHELLVKKLSLIRHYTTLAEFVTLAIDLFDRAFVADESGIEFVKRPRVAKPVEAVCQVCGEQIKSKVVFCRRCRTPHHEECWRYYGACSTYGCQETKYLRPKAGRAKKKGGAHV